MQKQPVSQPVKTGQPPEEPIELQGSPVKISIRQTSARRRPLDLHLAERTHLKNGRNGLPCRFPKIIYYLSVHLQYEIELPEFMEMAWLRHRSSVRWIIGICVGILGLLFGAIFYVYADHWLGFFLIGLSAFLLLLQLVIPSLVFRRVYRRNSRMFGERKVTISETGIVSDTQLGRAETTWNNYERFRETSNLFLLYQSADLIGILPKRVFASQEELDRIRTLLGSRIQSRLKST